MTRAEQIVDTHRRLCNERPELASSPITIAFVTVQVDSLRAFNDALRTLGEDFSDANVGALAHAAIRHLCLGGVMREIGAGVSEALLRGVGTSSGN